MTFGRSPNTPVAKINRLGFADYHCGICGMPILQIFSIADIDTPLPAKCPHCGKEVERKARDKELKKPDPDAKEKARQRARENRKKRFEALQANPNDKRHGTLAGYAYGCRCDKCRECNNEYQRQRRNQ